MDGWNRKAEPVLADAGACNDGNARYESEGDWLGRRTVPGGTM
jgi:hypothetical protein